MSPELEGKIAKLRVPWLLRQVAKYRNRLLQCEVEHHPAEETRRQLLVYEQALCGCAGEVPAATTPSASSAAREALEQLELDLAQVDPPAAPGPVVEPMEAIKLAPLDLAEPEVTATAAPAPSTATPCPPPSADHPAAEAQDARATSAPEPSQEVHSVHQELQGPDVVEGPAQEVDTTAPAPRKGRAAPGQRPAPPTRPPRPPRTRKAPSATTKGGTRRKPEAHPAAGP